MGDKDGRFIGLRVVLGSFVLNITFVVGIVEMELVSAEINFPISERELLSVVK